MHRILVEEKPWISESRFLHALNYCMLLPGPEAQQLATYIGWLMHRTRGGIVAGVLFVLPGFVAIMALSYVYAGFGDVPVVSALFFGLKAAVLAVVLEAVFRIGKRALKNRAMVGLAALAFVAHLLLRRSLSRHHSWRGLHRLSLPAPGPSGRFASGSPHGAGKKSEPSLIDAARRTIGPSKRPPTAARSACAAVWLALWLRSGDRDRRDSGTDNVFSRIASSSARWRS